MQDVARREQTWGHGLAHMQTGGGGGGGGRSAREILMLDAQQQLHDDDGDDKTTTTTTTTTAMTPTSLPAAPPAKRLARSSSVTVVPTSHLAARLAVSPPHARKSQSRDFLLRFSSTSTKSASGGRGGSGGGEDESEEHSPTSLREQCIFFVVAHSFALSPATSSPVFMNNHPPPTPTTPPSRRTPPSSSKTRRSAAAAAASALSSSSSAFFFLDSVSTVRSSSLPVALVRDLEDASRFYLASSSSADSHSLSSPSSPSSPPSRSATYASLPTRGRRRDDDGEGADGAGDFAYGPLGNSSPIPLSLRQRESTVEPMSAGMAMLTSPPRQCKTELVYRVVLVGDDCVGKSSICDMWTTGKCRPSSLCECTMGATFFHRDVTIDDYTVRLEVWDSGGQARFDNLTPMYITEADGVIAVYDVCSRESFEKAQYWVDQALTIKRGAPLRIILAGNKTDLLPSKSRSEQADAEDYARSSEVDGWLPVSARSNVNISALFKNMANCLVEAERARVNRKIVAALDVQATKSDAVSVSFKGVEGPLALAPVLGMRMGLLPTLPWLPDTAAAACMLCATTFSVTKRRHHCRRCGRVTCNRCSRQRVVLPNRTSPDSSSSSSPKLSSSSSSSSPSSPSKSPNNKASAAAAAERVCDHCVQVVACWTALRQ